MSKGRSGRERAVRGLLVLALALHVALFAWVVSKRLFFPFQSEWMTGSELDHIERVRQGLPVYVKPTGGWIPYIYPPLYLWLGALAGGTAVACRFVSLAAACLQAWCIFRLARDLGASRFWSNVGAALFIAAFPYCGWWYDLERSDTLLGAMTLLLCVILVRARSVTSFAIAGLLGGLAFFAKQQAVFCLAGGGVALVVGSRSLAEGDDRPRARDVLVFGGTSAGILVTLLAWCERASDGWFSFYVLKMPSAHGIAWALAPDVLPHDFGGGFLLLAATLAVLVVSARALAKRELSRAQLVFACMLGASFVAAVSSRLHIGGWINVLQPWSSFACVAVVWLASTLEARYAENARARSYVMIGVVAVVVGQLAVWLYDPRMFTVRPGMLEGTQRLARVIARFEESGDVLMPSRGHMTRARHFQTSAIADVVRVDGHSPPDLVDGLTERKYAAILDDARLGSDGPPTLWPPVMLEDIDDLRGPLLANYYIAERLDESILEIPMMAPAMARWVYLPRKTPLRDLSAAQLKQRQQAEMDLAQKAADAARRGEASPYIPTDIEALAAVNSKP